MRMAKLEVKLVVAMLLVGYDYTVMDEDGNQTNQLPTPNRSDTLHVSITFLLNVGHIF